MKKLLLSALALTLVGCAATKEYPYNAVRAGETGADALSVNLEPVAAFKQGMPQVTLGTGSLDSEPVGARLGNSVGVNALLVHADVPVPSLTVGPENLNAKVGVENGVTIGDLSVSQRLPSVGIGPEANNEKCFDLRLKNGPGITLPFLSLDIPWPHVGLKKE